MITSVVVSIIIAVVVIFITFRFILPDFLKKTIEQLIQISNEKLASEKQDIKTDLENKKSAFEKIAKDIKELIEKTEEKIERTDKDRIGSFAKLKDALENQAKVTEQLSATTESLRRVLSNNQMRGQFGEQVAENLLKMSGFVRGVDYDFNKEQKSGNRPDFVIYLPIN
jgi:Uncharacterized protein conserved in bacteria